MNRDQLRDAVLVCPTGVKSGSFTAVERWPRFPGDRAACAFARGVEWWAQVLFGVDPGEKKKRGDGAGGSEEATGVGFWVKSKPGKGIMDFTACYARKAGRRNNGPTPNSNMCTYPCMKR